MKKILYLAAVSAVVLLLSVTSNVYADDADTKGAEQAILEAMENYQESCDISQYKIPATQIQTVFQNVLYNHPNLFYVDPYFKYNYSMSGNTVLVLKLNYEGGVSNAKKLAEKYNAKLKEVESGIDASWSDLEKLLYIHDYICMNCIYDSEGAKDDAYDMLINGRASCQGYAKAFKQIANDVGITCTLVNSNAVNHQWNYVVLNGKYYYVDVTWDDLVPDIEGRVIHKHFLKSYSAILTDGMHDNAVNDLYAKDGSDVTLAISKTYDNYFWKDVESAFYYINGKWYAFDGKGRICAYSCNGKTMKAKKKLAKIKDKWYVWKDTRHFYTTQYVGVASYDGRLYYSTPDAVYEMNLSKGKSTKIYALSGAKAKKGNIYGLKIEDNGKVYVTLAKSGTQAGTRAKVFSLKTLGQPTLKSLQSTAKGIKVKWSKVTNASGYYVYKKVGSGKWKKAATVKKATKVSFVDKNAAGEQAAIQYKVYAYYKCPSGVILSKVSKIKRITQ